MTLETFCTSGQAERVKGGVHAAAGTILGVMAVYNAVAWWYRRERHLGCNAIIYTAALALEVAQTRRHFRRCVDAFEPNAPDEMIQTPEWPERVRARRA